MRLFQNPARSTIVACVYAGYVLIVTQYPFQITWDCPHSLTRDLSGIFHADVGVSFVLNIFLFVPFGFFCYQRLAVKKGNIAAILLATLVGAIFSLVIEGLQVFSARYPSAFDVISNTLGSSSGAVLSALWPRQITALATRVWTLAGGFAVAACGVLLYGAIPLILTAAQLSAPFRIWDSRHSFQLANEATLNRPWLGKIHFVALFNRALSPDAVWTHFHRGFDSTQTAARSTQGLVALYTFAESRGKLVQDVSGFGAPIDLVIFPESHVRWLNDSNGIEILKPAIVSNEKVGRRLAGALNATDELAIEVWITPRDLKQGGPARIVSFSRDARARNFTLGQEGSKIEFRLRTPASGIIGTPVTLWTTDDLPSSQPIHVVATYRAGVERLYVNGREQSDFLDLTKVGIIAFGTRKTPIAQMAYSFFYFFPVNFLLAAFFSRSPGGLGKKLLLSAAIGTGMLVATEVFQVFAFDRELDIGLLAYGLVISVIGALTGQVFAGSGSLNPEAT